MKRGIEKMEIHTELINKEIEEALVTTGDIEADATKIWNIISTLEGDEELKRIVKRIRDGYEIEFDIRSITKGFYEYHEGKGIIIIEKRKQYSMYEYWDEMEKRVKTMKEIIRSLYDDSFDKQGEETMEEYDKHE